MSDPEIDMRLYRLVTVENSGHEHQYNVFLNYDTAKRAVEMMQRAGRWREVRIELIPSAQVELRVRQSRQRTMAHLN